MKIAVRYFSKTGNTKKLADAIAHQLSIEAKDIKAPLEEKVDILFLCDSVYFAGIDSSVKRFLSDNKGNIGKLVNVSTAAIIESSFSQVMKLCEQYNIPISDEEFHCKGSFKVMHKGRPDSDDIAAVKAFAGKVAGEHQ